MLKIKDAVAPFISDESCVIVALLHDLGKVGMPGKPVLDHPWSRYVKNRVP